MNAKHFGALLSAWLWLGWGCGSLDEQSMAAPPTPAVKARSGTVHRLQVSTSVGVWDIAVEILPWPLSQGVQTVIYTITDAFGQPVTCAHLTVVPWMPAMGHGTSSLPKVTEIAAGVYEATDVVFSMAGRWELRNHIEAPADANFTVSFTIA